MKIAILLREETTQVCTASGCLEAFFQRQDSFARYKDLDTVELVAMTHIGGDLDKKIATLKKKGVQAVHLSSCLRSKSADYEMLADRLAQDFDIIGYTHGSQQGKTKEAVILAKKPD